MKKLVMMCLFFCSMTTISNAQKVTEQQLQGSWKMTGLTTQGVHLDIENKTVNIPQEMKSQLPPESIQQIEANMKQAATSLKDSYMRIEQDKITQVAGPQEDSGTFKLVEHDNQQFMDITLSNGQSGQTPIAMIDKKLQVTQSDGTQVVNFLYTKQ